MTAINRASSTATLDNEIGEKKQSAVHPHADGLASGVANMVIGTNYTVYYDLDGNLAAFVEGNVGSFVLITDGWYNQAVNAREYAVQAYIDGRLQTVNVTNNGSYFIGQQQQNNNSWRNLKQSFGNGSINSTGTNGNDVQTIVANLEDGNLIPVDKSYRVSQHVVMLDMVNNVIPTRDSNAKGDVYTTDYSQDTAYQVPNNTGNRLETAKQTGVDVLGRADTVYYYVHNLGTENNPTNLNGQKNYVVRTYTGYNNIPAIDPSYIEDVYAVGIQAGQTTSTDTNKLYYTAEVVVVELNIKYIDSRTASEQVFIPATGFVSGNIAGAGIETVNMIRGNGEVEEGVLVDMRQSRLGGYRAYDEADNSLKTSTIYAGLYYMDPVGTNADGKVIYKIENMDRAAIRSNNYLAGYVSQTNVTNDHVRVDGMTVNNAHSDFHDVPTHNEIVGDAIVDLQGATITSGSKLYKLGYSSSGVPDLNGNLSAAEVFYRNPDPNVTSTSECHLNELWNEVPGAGALFSGAANRVPRNEVLVRYDDNGNVIWAISFREFRSVNSSNVGTRDLAQTVWYNMLPAKDQVTTPTKFMNVAENGEGDVTHAGTDRTITITHTKAQEWTGKIVDVTSTSGSVVNYKLERWNAATNNWVLVPRTDADEIKEADTLRANTARAVYQLTIDLNQGSPIVYTLVKLKAIDTKTLQVKHNSGTWSDAGGAANKGYAARIDSTNASAPKIAVNDPEGKNMLINEFISQFRVSSDPQFKSVVWKFWNNNSQSINNTRWDVDQMSNVGYFTVTVTAEDGSTLIYTVDSPTAAPSETKATVTLPNNVTASGNLTTKVIDEAVRGETVTLTAPGSVTFSLNGQALVSEYNATGNQTTATFVVPETGNVTITVEGKPIDITPGTETPAILDGSTYNITGKVAMSRAITLNSAGATTTINIPTGSELDLGDNILTVSNGAKLVINGGGTIKSEKKKASTALIQLTGGSAVEITDTVVDGSNSSGLEGTFAVAVDGNGKNANIRLERVTIQNVCNGVHINNTATGTNTIEIIDCTIMANNVGAYLADGGTTTTIRGGSVSGREGSAVIVAGGSVTTENVILKTEAPYMSYVLNGGGSSGVAVDGAAIAVQPYTNSPVTLTVGAGTKCEVTNMGYPIAIACIRDNGGTMTQNRVQILNGVTPGSVHFDSHTTVTPSSFMVQIGTSLTDLGNNITPVREVTSPVPPTGGSVGTETSR